MVGSRRTIASTGSRAERSFFTVNLLDRGMDLLVTQIDALREAVRQTRARAPFRIDAWVVLPDHMHCLWTLPDGDADFPAVGGRSRSRSRSLCPAANSDHSLCRAEVNMASGRGDTGNTRFAMIAIWRPISN
jgi:REP element-mobilizing transposase RayT